MSFSDKPLSLAGSNGSGFGVCCPWKALATGPVVCPLASSELKNPASAKLALPVARVEITSRRDIAFISVYLPCLCLSSVTFLDSHDEHNRSNQSDQPGGNERNLRRNLPEQSTNCGRGSDRETTHQIVEPD